MIKQIFISGLLLLLISSCSITKKHNRSVFSNLEKKLILDGAKNEPMRVLLITNPKDSIVLRSKSQWFKVNKKDKILSHFTKRLYATVMDSLTRGVGIAAPQVGILKNIIWIKRFDKGGKPFEVYYNPEIKKYSEMKQSTLEGCLSIPNTRGTTTDRAYAIFLEYDNQMGEHKCEMIEDFTAVIFQHEIDHLNGILFTDHLKKERQSSIKHNLE